MTEKIIMTWEPVNQSLAGIERGCRGQSHDGIKISTRSAISAAEFLHDLKQINLQKQFAVMTCRLDQEFFFSLQSLLLQQWYSNCLRPSPRRGRLLLTRIVAIVATRASSIAFTHAFGVRPSANAVGISSDLALYPRSACRSMMIR